MGTWRSLNVGARSLGERDRTRPRRVGILSQRSSNGLTTCSSFGDEGGLLMAWPGRGEQPTRRQLAEDQFSEPWAVAN
jgi:hypothetical protein